MEPMQLAVDTIRYQLLLLKELGNLDQADVKEISTLLCRRLR